MLTLGRKWMLSVLFLAIGVSAFGQDRYQWKTASDIREGGRGSIAGTVSDINEARNQLTLDPDDLSGGSVVVIADAVTTQFNGFGGVINGKPEIFTGSQGFSNLRIGDRIEARGSAQSNATIQADMIVLRGRAVAASPTGVGTTRPPSSVSTPATRSTTVAADRLGRIEGIVRQVNANNNAIVVETDSREMITVRGSASTPVYYQNDVYHISNLEVGDRVRIEPDTLNANTGDLRARVIDVIRAVQDSGGGTANSVGGITGRVTRVDRAADIVTIDTGRGQVRVDVSSSTDQSGRRVRASDLQVGDRVDVSGRNNAAGDLFLATTVRFSDDVFQQPGPGDAGAPSGAPRVTDLGAVTIYGTISQSLANAPQLVIHDTQGGKTYRVYALEELVTRTKAGGYTTADKLREGDSVVVKAYRDADGNYIAQTIKLR
ncbi:MAG: DUF5666 domain-containing protein [Thermoanaerobaculia bacterium]